MTKNAPVAWGMEKDGVIFDVISPDEHDREEGGYTVPLYTTPQPKLETKDEPVQLTIKDFVKVVEGKEGLVGRPAYWAQWPNENASPQRTWVGLTDEDMNNALDYWSDDSRSAYGGAHSASGEYVDMIETWRYIEAKLKERNQ
jgi:hypothetical protein